MHKLANKFLDENEENRNMYLKVMKSHDQYYTDLLVEKFYNYIFKIYFVSYIEKSLRLKSLEFKRKRNKLNEREIYVLNTLDDGFEEERINTIPDESIDFIDEICSEIDIKSISANKRLNTAISNITSRQRLILFMHYIQDKEEKQIAKELNVSIQSVNKVKLAGLEKIKKYLGGELYGRVI